MGAVAACPHLATGACPTLPCPQPSIMWVHRGQPKGQGPAKGQPQKMTVDLRTVHPGRARVCLSSTYKRSVGGRGTGDTPLNKGNARVHDARSLVPS